MKELGIFEEFLLKIDDVEKQKRIRDILSWVEDTFSLDKKVGWNQPMFTDHGTFIIGFSIAKHHISIAPESKTIAKYSQEIINNGYTHTVEIFRIKWDQDVNYDLLNKLIQFNIEDKKDYNAFWRKA